MKNKEKVLWIIGGGQLQVPLIAEARKLGLKVMITDKNPNCLCKNLGDYFYDVDIFDIDANLKLLSKLLVSNINLAGILAAGIDANVTGAILAKSAGLPGVDPKASLITHNKALFRKFLTDNNLPCPKWEEVETEHQLKKAINRIGFPLIIKNIDSSASRGITKFFSKPKKKEFIEAFQGAKKVSSTHTALVEELLEGEEQTVETIFDVNGKFWPCFITDRIFDKKSQWATELGLRHPTKLPRSVQKKLYKLVEQTANKLGVTIGAAKADTMVTRRGPIIIEMTTRLSGGFDCQYLVPAATGKNILRAAILTAIGSPFSPELLEDKKHKVGLTASIWPKPGRVVAIEGAEEARKIPGLENIFFRYNIGDVVEPYIDSAKRACFVIVTGEDELSARKSLQEVLKTIKITTKEI